MKCEDYDLVAYRKGELAEAGRFDVHTHLESCKRCSKEMGSLDRVLTALGKFERIEPPADFKRRVREAFLAAHPEFLAPAHRTREEHVGWWAAFREQFSYVPAWTLSVSAHILILAILAVVLFRPQDPEIFVEVRAHLPREMEGTPEWIDDWTTRAPQEAGGSIGAGGAPEFTPDRTHPGFERSPEDRPFRKSPWDPRGWNPTFEKLDDRFLAFLKVRKDESEKNRLRESNGGRGTARAVAGALEWLRKAQREDGSWPAPDVEGENFRVGVTGLALLAFLGEGHTQGRGAYRKTVQRGLKYLIDQQKKTGLIGDDDQNYMYDHAIAATALLEAHLLEKDDSLRTRVVDAVMFTLKAQNADGGWGYAAQASHNDTSVMGWQIVLLRLYRLVDPHLPVTALNHAHECLQTLTDPESGRVGYRAEGEYPHREFSMTSVGMFAHMMSRPVIDERLVEKQTDVLLSESNPKVGKTADEFLSNDLYFWYFGSLGIFQRGDTAWTTWNGRLIPPLLRTQQSDGAWPADFDKWSTYGGRVYTTAMAALILETYYRYPRFVR